MLLAIPDYRRTVPPDFRLGGIEVARDRAAPGDREGYFWLGSVRPMTGPKQQGPVRSVRTLVIE